MQTRGFTNLTVEVVFRFPGAVRTACAGLAPAFAARDSHTNVSAGKGRMLTANMVAMVSFGAFTIPFHTVRDFIKASTVLVTLCKRGRQRRLGADARNVAKPPIALLSTTHLYRRGDRKLASA